MRRLLYLRESQLFPPRNDRITEILKENQQIRALDLFFADRTHNVVHVDSERVIPCPDQSSALYQTSMSPAGSPLPASHGKFRRFMNSKRTVGWVSGAIS